MDEQRVRQSGRRVTLQRRLILESLAGAEGPNAPEEIIQRVRAREPTINRSTIYRNLWALEEMGFVRHVHDGTGAERYHLSEAPPHLHLYCHRCGHLSEVDDVALAEATVAKLRDGYGFAADLTHFPIAGVCAHCAGG
jgi:Fur family ferric uptake transcriptional regulator